jgi:type I restriction enzyme S subunit
VTQFHRVPLNALVKSGYRTAVPDAEDEIWCLNLDQIEAHSGRVLDRFRIPVSELGPSTHAFERGTVLYSKLRPYLNKVVVADDNGVATTELVPIRCDDAKLNPNYLAHFLRGSEFLSFATNVVAGAKMPRMVMSEFWKYPVPLPPLPEQRRIAAILDQADALRTERRQALAELDRLAQAVFLEMFGDPLSNPMRWPDSGFGHAVESMQYGPRFYDESYSEDGVRIARITDLSDGGELDFESMPRMAVTEKDLDQHSLQPGDLIFARSGATVGKVALYKAGSPPCIPGAYFIRMKFRAEVNPDYASALMRTTAIREIVTVQSRQAAQQNFSGPGLRRLPFPIPPLTFQTLFAERLQAIESLKSTHRAALAESDALFASLQHRAFSGAL